MPILAAGNKSLARSHGGMASWASTGWTASHGFTLIELLVVVALIAVATAGATLSLRDSARSALERDAQRLAAVLESARAQARASDVTVFWQAQADGFVLHGLPRPATPQRWLSGDTRSRSAAPVRLGPEPLLPPQRIELYSASRPQQRLWVGSDGLQPFTIRNPEGSGP